MCSQNIKAYVDMNVITHILATRAKRISLHSCHILLLFQEAGDGDDSGAGGHHLYWCARGRCVHLECP